MVVPVDVNDEDLHILLRNKFFENLEANGNNDDYEAIDLEKLKNDDHYCKRFILHKKGKFDAALEMAGEALKWRKSFGVKNVTQASIPAEFFQAKAVFPYNKDKEDNPIIMILVRFHKKAPEFAQALRKFVIYWVELMEEQTNGGQMTVIMSCTGAGLSNLDLDLIKFLITIFRSYYPNSLAHILIYEMPWILNPAWKIIKAWLPEDFVDKIKFVNRTTLQDYVSEENLPIEMGGTNTTEYEPPEISNGTEPKRLFGDHIGKGSDQVLITDDYCIIGGILKISPASELNFHRLSESSSPDVTIKLTCVHDKPISFKVKTNNIESYRVKPSIGIIEPESTVEINVVLVSGLRPQASDKFLIMAMEVSDPNLSTPALNSVWKGSTSENIADHKLKCVIKMETPTEEEPNIAESLKEINLRLSNIDNQMQSLSANQTYLHGQQMLILGISVILFILLMIDLVFSEKFSVPGSFVFGFSRQ